MREYNIHFIEVKRITLLDRIQKVEKMRYEDLLRIRNKCFGFFGDYKTIKMYYSLDSFKLNSINDFIDICCYQLCGDNEKCWIYTFKHIFGNKEWENEIKKWKKELQKLKEKGI